jgi:hypothetical protein
LVKGKDLRDFWTRVFRLTVARGWVKGGRNRSDGRSHPYLGSSIAESPGKASLEIGGFNDIGWGLGQRATVPEKKLWAT